MGLIRINKNMKILILQLVTAIDAMYLQSSSSIDNVIINLCIRLARLTKIKALDIYKLADNLKKNNQLTVDTLGQSLLDFQSKNKYSEFNKRASFVKAPIVLHTRSIDDISDYPYPQCQRDLTDAIKKVIDAFAELNNQIKKYGKVAKSEMYLKLQDLLLEEN